MSIQPYIDLGWHTVPLKGKLERLDDGTKTVPQFSKDWRVVYQDKKNTTDTPLGGAITGKVSNIIAIDCDNEQTWQLFRQLDPEYDFVLLSKGKGYPAGTLVYRYDEELSECFTVHDGEFDLDFYSDRGFIYLATKANKTKVPMPSPLPQVKEVPLSIKLLLKQLAKRASNSAQQAVTSHNNVMTANCLAPMVEQFVNKKEFTPGLFRIITPKDFRTLPQYVENGYLHPNDIPDGRGSEYMSKISAILGADISIDQELYASAMLHINDLFDAPMQIARLEKTIMDPMITKNASINGAPIWKYDSNWSDYRLILTGKRQVPLELAFDDTRNMYYVVDTANDKLQTFHRDSELMAYVEAVSISAPKKVEVKRSLPIVQVKSMPNLPFGFNAGNDPTARILNTFRQTPELVIFNNPDVYMDKYKRPDTILQYLESLVPDEQMRKYLLSFVKTKLATFDYSPVILYFMGAHGSGKDLFVGILETILGKVSRPTTKEFLEMFNAWILDSYFVQLDEYGNQLTTIRDREEALGKVKAYTGKQQVQVRQMRTDGFMYDHNVTFIMTANKNPLMLEEGDRRIAFFQTPNVLSEQSWVLQQGGVAEVYSKIQAEIKDLCYYLATEVQQLTKSDYVKPPQSENKKELIADSMYAAQRMVYALKNHMKDYLVKLAREHSLDELANAMLTGSVLLSQLDDLYDELTDYNGDPRNFHKVLRSSGFELRATTVGGNRDYKILLGNTSDNPFIEETEDE
jgi:hypothetical protein